MRAPSTSTAAGARARAATRLVRDIVVGWRCQAIHAAVQVGIADCLADGARTAADAANTLDCHPGALERLLRALCVLGVVAETRGGRYRLTSAGRLLCSDSGDAGTSLRPLVQWWGGPLWPMWGELAYSVRTGLSAREKLTGDARYDHLARSEDTARIFHGAQHAMTALVLDDVARWPGWSGARTVVDVGGGHGQLALAMLERHRDLDGTVFDLPHARTGALQCIAAAGLQRRCRFEGGSFFERVPADADRYLLKSILHNWDDHDCAQLLATVRAAMPRHARLLVVERVLPRKLRRTARDEAAVRTDLNMLAGLGGRERSFDEYRSLLGAAGLEAETVAPLGFEFSLVEARPR